MKANRKEAFTLVEIMIVVAIIAILAAIAIPAFTAYRERSVEQTCLANVMAIQGAKEAWGTTQGANLNTATQPAAADQGEVENFMRGAVFPLCQGDNYTMNVLDVFPVCGNHDHGLVAEEPAP